MHSVFVMYYHGSRVVRGFRYTACYTLMAFWFLCVDVHVVGISAYDFITKVLWEFCVRG